MTTERRVLSAEQAARAYSEWQIRISPDGRRHAYLLKDQKTMVLDGKRVAGSFLSAYFSPDSKHFLYSTPDGAKSRVVFDGKKGKAYDLIGALDFSPDGSSFGYVAVEGKKWYAVINGKESRPYALVAWIGPGRTEGGPIVFSKDGRHHAFTAKKAEGSAPWVLVLDGKEHPLGSGAWALPALSEDGKRWACVAARGKGKKSKYVVIVDGKMQPGDGYELPPESLAFSPDGKRLAYTAFKDKKLYAFLDGKPFLGHPLPVYSAGSGPKPLFSPDGRRFAYVARSGKSNETLILDGKPQASHQWVRHLVFSPDSRRFAYVAGNGKREAAIVDGVKHPAYQTVLFPRFTPDSRSVIYYAGPGPGAGFAVIDGKPRRKYGKITCLRQWTQPFHFSGPDAFSYIAVKDNAYYWVEERRVKKKAVR